MKLRFHDRIQEVDFQAQSILYDPRTKDAHRSPWGKFGMLLGPGQAAFDTRRPPFES